MKTFPRGSFPPGSAAIRDQEATVAVRDPALADSPAQDAVARIVLPDDEVVRPVEGDRRRVLQSGAHGDLDPRRVEHGPGRRHARAIDVGGGLAGRVGPNNEVIRPVECEPRLPLHAGPRRDRDPAGIEHYPARIDARPDDRSLVAPDDEVVGAVEGDCRFRAFGRGDRESVLIEHGSARADASAVHLGATLAGVGPDDEVVRSVERDPGLPDLIAERPAAESARKRVSRPNRIAVRDSPQGRCADVRRGSCRGEHERK